MYMYMYCEPMNEQIEYIKRATMSCVSIQCVYHFSSKVAKSRKTQKWNRLKKKISQNIKTVKTGLKMSS